MRSLRKALPGIGVMLVLLCGNAAHAAGRAPLQIYFIDVEGGQSTLVVTPQGETLLIDAGFAGEGLINSVPGDAVSPRDPGRILAAMRDAGVARIDYLLATHFHRDHIGGIPELAQLVPVGTFIDYGTGYPPAQRALSDTDAQDAAAYDRYVAVRSRHRHLVPKPGDQLPLKGVRATVVSADRATLAIPLRGAGQPNPACRPYATQTYAGDENQRSTGVALEYGSFRFLDVGDLSAQPLFDLVCPLDRIGPVDLYLVAHHGNSTAAEPATLAAWQPRAAIVNNAPRKGGRLPLLQMLASARNLDGWQLHVSAEGGDANTAPERIANLGDDTAWWLKVVAQEDGSFTVANGRTGIAKSYGRR